MPRPSRAVLAGSAAYFMGLAVIALWPTHVDSQISVVDGTFLGRWLLDLGLSQGTAYRLMEFSANVLLYVPLGAIALLLVPRPAWWRAVALALTISVAFELLQAGLRPERTASVGDVVANTLGAALGAGLVVTARRALDDRRRSPRP